MIGLIVAGVVVLGLVFTAATVVGKQRRDAAGPTGPVKAEHCVNLRTESAPSSSTKTIRQARRVSCTAKDAKAKVVKVVKAGERSAFVLPMGQSEPDCPDGADAVMNVTLNDKDKRYWETCTRNLAGPHPGDPGAGGGMLGAGDCVGDLQIMGSEEPCTGTGWYGKVVARVPAERDCPASRTLETARLSRFGGSTVPRPVVCIGAGGKVLSSGDCIGDISFMVNGPQKQACSSQSAIAKITARVDTRKECPSGSDKFLEAENAYRPVLCLHQIRPTFDEKIKSLGGG
ncbi:MULTISPECIES: hypothetical protein [Thermomonosporaceae]|uniref:hypothetical protein n=1 Tax=Thermomonosporaceae TaxID=2012 RepID=UPI00255B0B4B|nr:MULTISPECIES: hypothetical protein [Thermomonosporaceae]MDL4772393.1 hypothetical protein [Actinomadura xylanilytica]